MADDKNKVSRHPHAAYADGLRDLSGEDALKGIGVGALLRDCADLIDALAIFRAPLPSKDLPAHVKLSGAEAITEGHMAERANYDAACDCWDAMNRAIWEGK